MAKLENLKLGRMVITAHGQDEQGEFVLINNGVGNFQIGYYAEDYATYRTLREIDEQEFCEYLENVKEEDIVIQF
jgi:hypothetical protein